MMDGIMEWLTEGDVVAFGPREKKVGIWVRFVVMILLDWDWNWYGGVLGWA